MANHSTRKNPAVLSHHEMRKMVGVIALLLPFALTGGTILLSLIGPDHALPHPLLQRSISDYRYTAMGDVYVGAICAIASFLMSARGYDLADEIGGYLAGIFALGVAFFPSEDPRLATHTRFQVELNTIHTFSAALMFLVLTYFCLVRFRMTGQTTSRTRRKRDRNILYFVCGITILVSDIAIVSLSLKSAAQWLEPLNPLLTFESLGLIAFGTAWLTKGQGFLRDRPSNHVHPSRVVAPSADEAHSRVTS